MSLFRKRRILTRLRMLPVVSLTLLLVYTLDGWSQSADLGGVFIPRNGGFEGRMGKSKVFFDQQQGGKMSIVKGEWPKLDVLAQLDMVFEVSKEDAGNLLVVKQSFDKNPRILFLEEGNERIGFRTIFKLFDTDNSFHGHGMTETWLYPDGEIFITAAAMFENRAAHDAVTKANLDITLADKLKNSDLQVTDMSISNQQVFLIDPDNMSSGPGLSLYWRTGKMEHNTYIYRSSFGFSGSPSYFRWPDYHRQAYTQRTLPDYISADSEKMPWPPGKGAYLEQMIPTDNGVQLQWPIDQGKANPTASFNAFFRLSFVDQSKTANAQVDAEREVVSLEVEGGVIHGNTQGYNDQEGCYEVRKTGTEPTTITLPSDQLRRTVRIKVIGLTGHGAVSVKLDEKPLVPQLSTDGGIADDPLAPIHDQPEAPANAALVTVQLSEKAQTLIFQEEEGIQLVYQSRDPRRNFMIYSTKTGPQWSGVQFSLLDGHARHMRAYGKRDWALTENLMHWFAYMGYTPEQMLDQLRDFKIIKNGPDEIVFKYTSNNANDGAQSEYEVRMAADASAIQMNVHATFTVLEQWPYKSIQYFDIFPFKGVEPKDWWYDNVLFMDSKYKWRTFKTVSQAYDGQQDKQSFGPSFQGLFSSDRGNMLMLTKYFTSDLPTHYIICSNYIDLHSNVLFDDLIVQPFTLEQGYQVSVEYELAIWGDKSLTRDQLIDIGKRSIEVGKLVLPDDI